MTMRMRTSTAMAIQMIVLFDMRDAISTTPGPAYPGPSRTCATAPDVAGCETARVSTPRPYDIVLFGATGFTGALTARYLAEHAPATLRWALAGRSLDRLAAVRETLAGVNPACADLPLLPADVAEPDTLRRIAESSRTVISTVGPYLRHGEPVVAACAEAGTDYLDITGEPEFVDLMYLRYHERAIRTGARIVHGCGFDSIPTDLGVHYTVGRLPEGVPITVDGYLRGAGYAVVRHVPDGAPGAGAAPAGRRGGARPAAGGAGAPVTPGSVGAPDGRAGRRELQPSGCCRCPPSTPPSCATPPPP